MTRAGGAGRGRRRRRSSVALLAVALAACGVDAQPRPEPVPVERLPSAAPAPSTTPVSRARVWGARNERLVPVLVDAQPMSVAERLRALLALSVAEPDQPRPSVIPAGTEVERVSRDGDLVVLALSAEFREVAERSRPVALGQLVLTVTELPGIAQVTVTADGALVPLLDGSARVVSRPLRRSDFAELVTGGLPD